MGNYNTSEDLVKFIKHFLAEYATCFNEDLRCKIPLVSCDKCSTFLSAISTAFNDMTPLDYQAKFEQVARQLETSQVERTGEWADDAITHDQTFCLSIMRSLKQTGILVLQHIGLSHAIRAADRWVKKKVKRAGSRRILFSNYQYNN